MVLVNAAERNANALVVCASLSHSDATLMKPHLQALRVEQQSVCQLLALLVFLLCFSHHCRSKETPVPTVCLFGESSPFSSNSSWIFSFCCVNSCSCNYDSDSGKRAYLYRIYFALDFVNLLHAHLQVVFFRVLLGVEIV